VGRARKPKSLEKRIAYQLIKRDSKVGEKMYEVLDHLVEKHHEELDNAKARIALAWARSWKPDVDGVKKLGQCKKASDLDRELMPYDFVILLSQAFYEDAEVSDEQRAALIDHELTHATIRLDKNDEPMVDERGRNVFRTRKHDVEEFSEIISRHGIWKKDLIEFAKRLKRSRQFSLLDQPPKAPAPPTKPTSPATH